MVGQKTMPDHGDLHRRHLARIFRGGAGWLWWRWAGDAEQPES
jgi:hypothetical protein